MREFNFICLMISIQRHNLSIGHFIAPSCTYYFSIISRNPALEYFNIIYTPKQIIIFLYYMLSFGDTIQYHLNVESMMRLRIFCNSNIIGKHKI